MTIDDIVNSVYFRTKTNSSSFLAADMLLYINNALDRVVSLILRSDSKWQFDDSNQTDLPIATAALVATQQDYSLATTHLTLDRVEVLDEGGDWNLLRQIDRTTIQNQSLTDYQKTDGDPKEYDLLGNSVILYPAPDYSLASALKLFFTRGGALYTSAEVSTGTKVPGFNSLFHDLIPLWVSYEYAIANNQKTANGFLLEIQRKEDELDTFFGNKNRSLRPRFTIGTNGLRGSQSGVVGLRGGDSNK